MFWKRYTYSSIYFFIEPTSIQASILEYKSKPADFFEAHVGIIASSFIKTISIIVINLENIKY